MDADMARKLLAWERDCKGVWGGGTRKNKKVRSLKPWKMLAAKSRAMMGSCEDEQEASAPPPEKEDEVSEEEELGENIDLLDLEATRENEQRASYSASIAPMLAGSTTIPEAEKERLRARRMEECDAWIAAQEKLILETREDYEAWRASQFRAEWSGAHGSFEDITKLGPMRFTDDPAPPLRASELDALQIFSVKIAGIRGDLQWPLDVFGIVAVRDVVDFNRNIIFNRTRDSCQKLTKEDPYLVLIGPTRAVVWLNHVTIEVKLTVKGSTESEDKDLSFLAVPLSRTHQFHSYRFNSDHTSMLSTLDFTLGHIVDSVEATIFVRVTDGAWPEGSCGQFVALTTGVCDKDATSIDHEEILLLDSGGEKLLVAGDGQIMLSRHVVSVDIRGKLKIRVKASEGDKTVVEDELVFAPKRANRSSDILHAGFCMMEVTVAWSLISDM
ncbi:hypothetical protein ACP70R_005393 [Stipagrostis hirtigluma subsp. patula]